MASRRRTCAPARGGSPGRCPTPRPACTSRWSTRAWAGRGARSRCGRRADRLLVGPDNGLLLQAAERFGGVAEARESPGRPGGSSPFRPRSTAATSSLPSPRTWPRSERPSDAGEPLDPATLVRLTARSRRDGERHGPRRGGRRVRQRCSTRPSCPSGDAALGGPTVTVGRTFADVAPGELVLYEDSAGSSPSPQRRQRGGALGVRGRRRAAAGAGVTLGRPADAPAADRLHQRPGARAGRGRRAARRARHRRRADRGPRPPGPHVGHAAGHGHRRLARPARVRRPAVAARGARRRRRRRTGAKVKWPNDVWLDGRKIAGMLVETRNGPPGPCSGSASMSRRPATCRRRWPRSRGRWAGRPRPWSALTELLAALERRLAQTAPRRAGRPARARRAAGPPPPPAGGEGIGAGIDDSGALLVTLPNGGTTALSAGEVTLSAGG